MNAVNTQELFNKYLRNIKYPVSTGEIFDVLRDHGADQGILDALEKLPDQEFKTGDDVSRAVSSL